MNLCIFVKAAGCIVFGVDGKADQIQSVNIRPESDRLLKFLDLGCLTGACRRATGKHEVGDPHPSLQFVRSKCFPGLICKAEIWNFE